MMSLPHRLAVLSGLVLLSGCGLAAAAGAPAATTPAPPAAAAATPTAPPPAVSPVAAAPVVPVVSGPAAQQSALGKPMTALNETQQYCSNIAAAAADARFAWQRKQITDLQAQLKQRIDDLDAKEAEFRIVLARRDEMMKKAADTVVGIYSHMKPDAAATQLAELDDEMAAAILAQLSQRQASTILNEIPAEKAAKLVNAITAVAAEKKS